MYNPFSMKRILNPVGSGVITFGGGSSEVMKEILSKMEEYQSE